MKLDKLIKDFIDRFYFSLSWQKNW